MLRQLIPAVTAAVLFVVITAIASANSGLPPTPGVSIARSDICINYGDCPANKYCKFDLTTRIRTCVPRLPIGAICDGNQDCSENSFCDFTLRGNAYFCRPQGTLNEKCTNQFNSCRNGLTCTLPSLNSCTPAPACLRHFGRCLPRKRLNEPCRYDHDCVQDAGLYCNGQKACARKKPAGSSCGNTTEENECADICVSGSFSLKGRKRIKRCASYVPLGGLCVADDQCGPRFPPRPDRKIILCYKNFDNRLARCTFQSKLLRNLGAACNPKRDLCDLKRGLVCRWAPHLKRAVCQQRIARVQRIKHDPFCTRGSKLSECPFPPRLFPTECRARRRLPGPTDLIYQDYTRCELRRRVIQRGMSCHLERDICEKGSVCRVIPGVLPVYLGPTRHPWQPAVFCVKILKLDEPCQDSTKFVAQCGDGLRCSSSKCVPHSGKSPSMQNTHANVLASCKDLPCAPGFTCGGDSRCRAPVTVKKGSFGELCDRRGVFAPDCKPGLVCRTKWGSEGLDRCDRPKGVGAYCELQSWCEPGLECVDIGNPTGVPSLEKRCIQPATSRFESGTAAIHVRAFPVRGAQT